MDSLNEFYEQIKDYKKITLTDAKKMLLRVNETDNEEEKKKIINTVYIGTLHYVYAFLKNVRLHYFESSKYEMEDYISESCLLWYEHIANFQIYSINNISKYFITSFANKVSIGLVSRSPKRLCGKAKSFFLDFFKIYIDYRNNNDTFYYNEYMYIILKKYNIYHGKCSKKLFIDNKMIDLNEWVIYYEYIYNRMSKNGEVKINIPENHLYGLYELFIDQANFEAINNVNDTEEEIMNNDLNEQLEKIINKLPDHWKEIVKYRFGFTNGQAHTLEATAKKYGITRERVRQIESKALGLLRTAADKKEVGIYLGR